VFFFFVTFCVSAQNIKFGKVSKEELLETKYEKDSSAVAAVLYRKKRVSYDYIEAKGFVLVTRVHERIKIYNKEGFKYATIRERLYKSGSDRVSISGLKAYTYNIENGKVVKQKLSKSDTFSESVSKYYNEEKFTMPNIKEGSVIEYEYIVDSPFTYSIDEIYLQYDIPIKNQNIKISMPEYYSFKPNMKGYLQVAPKISTESDQIVFVNKTRSNSGGFSATSTNYSTNAVDYTVNVSEYNMKDVPALKKESFVNNMNNYRASVNYELQYVQFPQQPREAYATTWESVVKKIYDSDNFGEQLKSTSYLKNDLETVLENVSDPQEKIAKIFFHIQKHMNWNKYYGKYTDLGVKKAYREKKGSVADINLILVAMLREAGLEANPVLVSTRDNGVPLFPTNKGFNYVVASVKLDGNVILMDACNKYTTPQILPTRALNWFGRLIKKDGTSQSISMFPKKPSKESCLMQVSIDEKGLVKGRMRKSYLDYKAYIFRNKNNSISEDDYLEKLESKNEGMEISSYEIKNKKALGQPIMEKFSLSVENQADIIGNKIYFSPLFFNTKTKNPFKLEERNYPIDFAYPWQEKYALTITIPEGYKVESIPENMSIGLQDKMGSFIYKIVEVDNSLQVMVDLKVNVAVIPANNYKEVKEFYKKIVEKETEKVVLSKI